MKVHYVKHTVVSGGMPVRRTYLTITPDGKGYDSTPAVVFAPALNVVTDIRYGPLGAGIEYVTFFEEALALVRVWIESGREDFSEFEEGLSPSETTRGHTGTEVQNN